MTPHEAPGDADHDDLTPTGGDPEQPQAAEPEREPKPVRTGSIAPPGAVEPEPEAAEPPARGGGLLDRIRRKLGR